MTFRVAPPELEVEYIPGKRSGHVDVGGAAPLGGLASSDWPRWERVVRDGIAYRMRPGHGPARALLPEAALAQEYPQATAKKRVAGRARAYAGSDWRTWEITQPGWRLPPSETNHARAEPEWQLKQHEVRERERKAAVRALPKPTKAQIEQSRREEEQMGRRLHTGMRGHAALPVCKGRGSKARRLAGLCVAPTRKRRS